MDKIIIEKIDYTLLDDQVGNEAIVHLCANAERLGVKSVCVMPVHVSLAKEILKDSQVLVCTVISFPHGIDSIQSKIRETIQCLKDGADEIDLVMNYSMIGQPDLITLGLKEIERICHAETNKLGEKVTLKVIVESGLLNPEQTALATKLCIEAGVDYIKTSTGKVEIGAELSKIQIMRNVIMQYNSNLKIKASGGIRTMEQISLFNPYVERFGIGSKTVDDLLKGEVRTNASTY